MSGNKAKIRQQARASRNSQSEKDATSRSIISRITGLTRYLESEVILWYVDVRDEVRTKHALPAAISSGKKIAVPYCIGDELSLFHLESMDELREGKYAILEPRKELRRQSRKSVPAETLDLILVPGVAFDRTGGRLGHGKGYYDRLLSRVPASVFKIGVAFDCQLFDAVPTERHDVAMNMIVTQSQLLEFA